MTSAERVSVYMTAGSMDEALTLARTLVDERLAACVNVLGGARSLYRWEGRIEEADEVALLAKTRGELAQALCDRATELHGYDVPCVVAWPIVAGCGPYLAWLDAETRPST